MTYSGSDFYCDVALKDTSHLRVEYEDDNVLAFHHTNPSWPTHIVVVPKKHIASFTDRSDEDMPIIQELLEVVRTIAQKIEREKGAARILTNLGGYQDSKHLHFHINHGDPIK